MSNVIARRYKAKYASTMVKELVNNVTLEAGEEFVYVDKVRRDVKWLFGQPGMLALTPHRIILLEHNLFSSDWILEIPHALVSSVDLVKIPFTTWVEVTYRQGQENLRLKVQPMMTPVVQDLFEVIEAFQHGNLVPFVASKAGPS